DAEDLQRPDSRDGSEVVARRRQWYFFARRAALAVPVRRVAQPESRQDLLALSAEGGLFRGDGEECREAAERERLEQSSDRGARSEVQNLAQWRAGAGI